VLLLRPVLERAHEGSPFLGVATTIGAIAVVASLVGFLRWVFVVPGLAEMYVASGATEETRRAISAAYWAQHQLAGTLLGEHVSQALSVIWSLVISAGMFRSRLFQPWLGVLGVVASVLYLLSQSEILHTAISSVPEIPVVGLVGSSLWGLWMLLLGVALLRAPER
jgi:hypothetical protein